MESLGADLLALNRLLKPKAEDDLTDYEVCWLSLIAMESCCCLLPATKVH